ncbi:hypothetical protein ACMD2_11606 [Ananas comosus]|uniref:Uncharacterized protein n=1 Tax=Ananas comosus TaxID=4615 RepID=A0A199W9K6_ANACO|nr:hypothetical protein ACMD2_11606 [Ananas comosus]
MGACASRDSAEAAATATAKVVLPGGGLREYAGPVRAAHVLRGERTCLFVCDADAMEIEGFVGELGDEEELLPGQIYFLLPRSMLKRPIRADEIAALAVRASEALLAAAAPRSGGRGRRRAVAPLVFAAAPEDVEKKKRMGGARKGSGRGRKFEPDLGAIPE